jgi:hypothetical protein
MACVLKVAREKFPWHAAFTAVPNFIFFSRPALLYCEENVCKCIYIYICMYVCIYIRTCIYIYISDSVKIVYELPLLPNNAASETFCYKLGAVFKF